jgi:hypothetical protein
MVQVETKRHAFTIKPTHTAPFKLHNNFGNFIATLCTIYTPKRKTNAIIRQKSPKAFRTENPETVYEKSCCFKVEFLEHAITRHPTVIPIPTPEKPLTSKRMVIQKQWQTPCSST